MATSGVMAHTSVIIIVVVVEDEVIANYRP